MTLFLKTFFLTFTISLLIYWIPKLSTPLHSDVIWIFRLQTSEINLENLPPWSKVLGAYPGSSWETFIKYHNFSGRYNFLDWQLFRLNAEIFGNHADVWRFGNLIILSVATTLFYLISQILKINRLVAFILVFGIMLSPVSVWTDYKTSEPKALLLLMLAYYLALRFSNFWALLFSSIAIVAAVLTKESFLGASFLAPALIYLRNRKNGRQNLNIFFPYIFALFSLGIYFLVLNFFFPNEGSDYVFDISRSSFSPPVYFFYSFWNSLPLILTSNGFIVGILLLSFIIFLSLPFLKKQKIIILFLLLAFLASVIPYFLTKRDIYGHYLLPGNFLMALLVGILVTPPYNYLFSKVKSFWSSFLRIGFLAAVLIILVFDINGILKHSKQDRIDQNAWQNLISNVAVEAPQNGHVVLEFDDPYMIETAYSLEANTLFAKRYDLTYHLEIEDKGSAEMASDFVKKNIELFNLERQDIGSADNVLYVKADRKGGTNFQPYLNWQIDE